MKKLLFAVIMIIGLHSLLSAQVKKTDFESLLKINETSMDKITSLYIGNVKTFYTDGTWKWTDSKYKSVNGEYTNEFLLMDNGFVIKSTKSGKMFGTDFISFSSIKKIYVTATSIDLHLLE